MQGQTPHTFIVSSVLVSVGTIHLEVRLEGDGEGCEPAGDEQKKSEADGVHTP